jgi:hypothetical protein
MDVSIPLFRTNRSLRETGGAMNRSHGNGGSGGGDGHHTTNMGKTT